ncbi:MAG: hypothetical protein C0616_00575 [Desulfuromonas sp.]|nr:MAG: hypothetical protein C0616_00575 [Desulfuromonas sp.]
MQERSDLLSRLLENPLFHEHDIFSELLVAVLHLKEELHLRPSLAGLQAHFPFLYSLAVRTNPFDSSASIVIVD